MKTKKLTAVLFISLMSLLAHANTPPTVNITAPVFGTFYAIGTTIAIKANAHDVDGTITSVYFYVDGNYVGSDLSFPYSATYTTTPGNHILTAIASDNSNTQTTSAPVTISILNTNPPNGLENILVEKYYVANAADAAQADTESVQNSLPTGALPIGSVTYRFYADLLPGYKILQVFADETKNHSLKFTTTTSFYNSPNGTFLPANTKATIKNNLLSLDSYLTLGAAAIGNYGVIKAEDNGVANNVTVSGNPAGVLLNNDPAIGLPLTTQDGIIAAPGTFMASFAGFSADNEDAIGDGAILSNTLNLIDGAVYTTVGATGPDTTTNKVLIAQITTNGILHYELNLLLIAPDGTGQYFVAQHPKGDEITISSLTGTLDGGNIPPTVTLTAPLNGAIYPGNTAITISANAIDTDGSIASVEFLVDTVSVGIDTTAPYAVNYIVPNGSHVLTAKATDNNGAQVVSNGSLINVGTPPNIPPTVSVTAPVNGDKVNIGTTVVVTANANDTDGSVSAVEFFLYDNSIGIDSTAPYSVSYTAATLGTHHIKATAIDNLSALTSSTVLIKVIDPNNQAPLVSILTPSSGTSYLSGSAVTISADALDTDGDIASVKFYLDGSFLDSDYMAPYTTSFNINTPGSHIITVVATDDGDLSTTSAPVAITVINAGGQPYTLGALTGACTVPSFCLPVIAIDTVKNVIGYDLVLNYDKTKVNATGNVTLNNALLNAGYASYAVNNDAANGLINISVFLNATAPANAAFNGTGELLCVEFTKLPGLLASDTADFNVSFLQESYTTGVSTKLANAGSYINTKSTLYGGSLKFWSDNSPIRYNAANPAQYLITNIYGTDVNCANKSLAAVQPDVNGNFVYDAVNGTFIQIERDILPTTDVQVVINGFDASLGHKVLVNDLSFIPTIYQAIALDVNTDGVISAGDISQINQRSVKTITEFKQKWNYNNNGTSNGQLSKDWLFLDSTLLANPAYKKSLTYPSNDGVGYSKAKVPVVPFCLQVPVVGGNTCPVFTPSAYTGVLLGDVNGNYDAIPADGQIKKQAGVEAMGTVYMNLDQATAGAGYIDIPVSFVSSEKVVALDFATKFNENTLSFEKVITNVSYLTDALANVAADDKILRFTSNSTQAYEADKNIVSIRFKTLGNITNADISTVRGLLNGTEVKLELKGNITTGISTNSSNISVQVYPNPASNVINVVSPERAVVELLDLQGRQIVISTMVNANEKQEINTEKIASGMYMIKIFNENFISTQRITIDN
jgi:hypothetical protein